MRRITFKKFAGVRIKGSFKFPEESLDKASHLKRAAQLTAHVESGGLYGAVTSYDGTGITAGIHQAVAVYPRNLDAQGPLWKLLSRVFSAACITPSGVLAASGLRELLSLCGVELDPSGVLRMIRRTSDDRGRPVGGEQARHLLTGSPSGVMPVRGSERERAEDFAWAFHELFSEPSTFGAQDYYGQEHFVKRAERSKLRFSGYPSIKRKNILDAVYGGVALSHLVPGENISEELDLAMSMYWSNSVNAPAIALKKLSKVLVPKMAKNDLARALIRALGNTSFGRWDDDIKQGRYQRTRRAAMKMWPRDLFVGKSAIMPKNLPG